MRRWTTALLVLVPAALVLAQSLGDLARQEQERRKQREKAGARPRVFTEDDLKKTKGQLANNPSADAAVAPAPEGEPAPSPGAPASGSPPPSPAPSGAPPQASPSPASSPPPAAKAGKAEWQSRISVARGRVDAARRRHEELSGRLARSSGKSKSLEADVAQARQQLEAAQEDLENLREAAHREGVPEDWLR